MRPLPPMLQRVHDAIRVAGRIGITRENIAYAIGWYNPGHGPLASKTVGAHIDRVRARGIGVVCFFIAGEWRYKLANPPLALRLPAGGIDRGAPLDRPVTRQLGRGQPGQLHHRGQPIGGNEFPLINGETGNVALLSDCVHQAARLGDLLQSDTAFSHSNLISNAQAKVKPLTSVKLEDKQAT